MQSGAAGVKGSGRSLNRNRTFGERYLNTALFQGLAERISRLETAAGVEVKKGAGGQEDSWLYPI